MRTLTLTLTLAVILTSALAQAQGTYTQIDYPGASSTFLIGINSMGDMVGYYTDPSGVPTGFIVADGVFTAIRVPHSKYSYAYRISDMRQIVGSYFNGKYISGYELDFSILTFTNFHYPGSTNTRATGINNAGQIVGWADAAPGHFVTGFEIENGTFQAVRPHRSMTREVIVNAINDYGQIVGYLEDATSSCSFEFDGSYERVLSDADDVQAWGINNAGVIVGIYYPVPTQGHGFVLQDGTIQDLLFPGSIGTSALGINDAGQVVGSFTDSNGQQHGFLWTPPAGEHQ